MYRTKRAVFGVLPLLIAASAAPISAAHADAGAGQAPAPVPEVAAVPAGGASMAPAEQSKLVRILERRLVTSGTTASLRARALFPLHAELRVAGTQAPIATAEAAAGDRFRLQGAVANGDRLELVVRRTDGVDATQTRRVGTVVRRKLRAALASWYGPGLYGNRTACGLTLTTGLRGVAHRSLPCGTTLTVSYRGKTTSARVVDRGPFHGSREFDLTYATARAIGFKAVGTIRVSR